MAELVDTQVLEACAAMRESSSLSAPTTKISAATFPKFVALLYR